jgi:uncharacterized OB-fold protein
MAQGTNPHLFSIDAFEGGAALNGTHCRHCGKYTLMHVPACPHCLSREVEKVPIGRRAKLRYWSVVHHPADGFPAPYVIGEVATEEGPIAFAPIVADPARLAAGTELVFRLRPTADGKQTGFAYMLPGETA